MLEIANTARPFAIVVQTHSFAFDLHTGDDVKFSGGFDRQELCKRVISEYVQLVESRCVIVVTITGERLVARVVDPDIAVGLVDGRELA